MAYPTSTFHRSDSQAGFYNQTQQQGSSASTSQQGQQHQSSRPRFETRSSSSSSVAQRQRSEFYGHDLEDDWQDQQLDNAKTTVRLIKENIRSICASSVIDIEQALALFEQIKKAQKQSDLSCVRASEPALIESLSDPLCQLIKKLDSDLKSPENLVSSFNAEDIHALFNGLSAIVGESVGELLLSVPHFKKLKQSLSHITEILMEHAIDRGFLQKQWDSSSLFNVLNWLSRGLKKKILSSQNPILRKAFTQALMIMKDWTSSTGEAATTSIAALDTRQLGKCMVQVSTALNYGLVTEEAPDHLLRDVVLGLCGGKALDQCRLWKKVSNSSQNTRVLTSVMLAGVEITNISNAVKDCLKDGILRLEDEAVQSIINKLCRQINLIPEPNLLERQGQRLGNCGNFLRQIFECEYAAAKFVFQSRDEYDKACKRVLDQILKISPVVSLYAQPIANLFSFVKAMDRTRRQPTEILRAAASVLVGQLWMVREEMSDPGTIAATLSGLHHLALRWLIKPGPAVDQMIIMINAIDLKDLAAWPEKSRLALMNAAVYCWQDLAARKVPLPRHCVLEIMNELLALPEKITEKYAYLMAAAVLIEQDGGWLKNHQGVLRRLLPAKSDAPFSEDDVMRELAHLIAGEPVVEKVPEPETTINTTTTTATTTTITTMLTTTAATTTIAAAMAKQVGAVKTSPQRVPVSVTRVIEPANKSTETSNTDPATKKNPAPLVSKLTVESPKEYRVPKRKAKVNPDQITVLPSTVPVLKVRDTSSSIRASVPNNKSAPEKPAKPEKTPSPPPKNQLKSAPKEVLVSNSAKQTPEQEWFQLLKQEGALSTLQLKRVQELLEKTPRLAISVEGKGRKVRTALFYALSTGKAEAVGLIMRANSKVKQDMAGTLRQVFDEILIVGDSEVGALKACLSMLSESELAVLRDALNQQYKPGEMRKKLAMPLLDVLRDMGAIPAEPEGIDDSRNQSFVRDKKIIRDNWVEPLPRTVMAGDTKSAESLLRKNSGDELPSNSDLAGSFASLNAAKSKLADLVSANVSLNAAKSKLADLVSANVSLNASISKLQDAITLSNNQKLDAEQATMAQNFGWNAVMRTQNALAEVKKSSVNRDSWAELAKVVLEDGWNALMLAAQNNQAAVVKSLIDHASGAEQAKMVKKDGWNALMLAAQNGHTEVVKLLMNHASGAEQAKVVLEDGWNALMLAAQNNQAAVVKSLIDHASGAEQVKMVTSDGRNALMLAAQSGSTEVVKLLVNHTSGAEQVKMVNKDGWNALMIAAGNGHTEVIKLLMIHDSGAEQVKMVTSDGRNALMLAAQNGHTEVVKLLVNHTSGAEQVKMVNKDGWNALMLAAQSGSTEVVKLLVNHTSGAEQVKMVNKDGWNALMIAAGNGHTEVIKLLMIHDSGAEQVKMVNKDGWNALMIAAGNGHTEVIKLLMNHDSGAEQVKMVNKNGWNALMIAAGNGHTEVIKLLMNHDSGAEQVKMVNKDGWNALMLAAQNGHTEVVKLLMNHDSGAEQAKVVSNDGFNALLVAVEDGRTDVVEVLVRHKSCIDQVKVVNKAGLNALELAMKNGNQAIVDLLTPFM